MKLALFASDQDFWAMIVLVPSAAEVPLLGYDDSWENDIFWGLSEQCEKEVPSIWYSTTADDLEKLTIFTYLTASVLVDDVFAVVSKDLGVSQIGGNKSLI